jgi:FTR1 family protein
LLLTGAGCAGLLIRLLAALALCGLASAEEAGAIIVKDNDDRFSIPAFVIGVRESIEGCVIAAVLLNACHKSGQTHMKAWVWFGVIVGCVSFLVAGAICLIVFYSIRKNMPGAGKAAFEGVLAVLACCVLTHISLKFLRLKDLIMKWESKLVQDKKSCEQAEASAPARLGCWAGFMNWISDFRAALNIRNQAIDKDQQSELTPKMIVVLAWSAIFREGLETVIFLLPLTGTTKEAGLVAGCLAGIACGIVFGLIVLYVGKVMLLDPTWFFNLTTLFIFFIAAGLATYATIEIEQIWAPQLQAINHPVYYRPLYNIGCLHQVYGRVWTHEMDTKCFLPENEGTHTQKHTHMHRGPKGGIWVCNNCFTNHNCVYSPVW